MRNVLLLSLAGLALALAGLLALLAGCGGSRTEVDAREHRSDTSPAGRVEISHWKQTGLGSRLYGMIVEQEGHRVSADLYALEDGEGLMIREKEARGKFFPDRQAIIFPLYNPAAVTAEKWIAQGGPHIVVPWTPDASTLTGTLKDPSRTNSYTFGRLESAMLTNGLGVVTVSH
jgi:hypothetical protein